MKELIETQHEVDEQEAAEYDAIAMDVGELPPDCASFSLYLLPLLWRVCLYGRDTRATVPDQTYENIEAVARETFAIAEELKQVNKPCFKDWSHTNEDCALGCVCAIRADGTAEGSHRRDKESQALDIVLLMTSIYPNVASYTLSLSYL